MSDQKVARPAVTPAVVVTAVVMAMFCAGTGLLAGYYYLKLGESGTDSNRLVVSKQKYGGRFKIPVCEDEKLTTSNAEILSFHHSCEVLSCAAVTCDFSQPRSYVVYHLSGQKIDIDGKLDDKAWTEGSWTDDFVDIQGDDYPAPEHKTRVKIRWDDVFLYVGALLEASDVWANKTLHDSTGADRRVVLSGRRRVLAAVGELYETEERGRVTGDSRARIIWRKSGTRIVFEDNAFQVLLDSERSNHKYKEIAINALGTVSDTMITKPFLDDGEPIFLWESALLRAVYSDGPINNPNAKSNFWQVEMAVPFKQLAAGAKTANSPPKDREIWRGNFVRSNWKVEIINDKYQKRLDQEAAWWVWSSPGVANIHLPDRWGLLQFRKVPVNTTVFQSDPYWPQITVLFDIYRAEHAYKSNTGFFTDSVQRLDLLPYALSGFCVQTPEITLDGAGFVASVKPTNADLREAHIRADRYLWLG